MISQDAKKSFQSLLSHSFVDSLTTEKDNEWEVSSINDISEIAEQELFMLTISSYRFRIFLLFYFTKSEALEEYVSGALHLPRQELENERFYDFLGEVGNKFCGAIKRELGHHLPHMGMSTPNRLNIESIPYISDINFDFKSHIKAESTNNIVFHSSLCVMMDGELDFRIQDDWNKKEEAEAGELELF
jgi:hypothetical protein